MKQQALTLLMLAASASPLLAQETRQWSLDDCISYALEKNIQLQQDKISLQEAEVDVKTAKAALFPTLSLGTSHTLVNRPYQKQSSTVSGTEIITSNDKNTYNGNYNLSAQWTLWNGGRRLNTIKTQQTNRDIARLAVDQTGNTLQEEIARLFIQLLYADESLRINRHTLEVSQATCERGQQLYEAGSLSKVDLAQLEAQASSDAYQVVSAESALRNYRLQLKQLLELGPDDDFEPALPVLDDAKVMALLPDQADVYAAALAARPEIQSSKLSIENARLAISTAKAGYLPTISLSSSSSSMTNSASTSNWAQQMKYGWNNMIGISLSLPLYDGRAAKSSVQKARLAYSSSLYTLESRQKELYATIESLWLDALNAQQQFAAAEAQLKSSQASFDLTNEQFGLGVKNTVELLTEKNNLLNAQQQRVQAKYMALLDRTLLNFYAGNPIEL
ncbi:MAG: TolC family protein [Phocaeicola plebeius]